MKTICLNFKIHQPYRLKRYRFFSIGVDHIYADDMLNSQIMKSISADCYREINTAILKYADNDKIKVGLSASGVALQQLKELDPTTFRGIKKLSGHKNIEFLGQTYAHSLACLTDEKEFKRQVEVHKQFIKDEFGRNCPVFCNTGMIYSNAIAESIAKCGYKSVLTEGKPGMLEWRSPDFVYRSNTGKPIDVLTRNYLLSDRFAQLSSKGESGAKTFLEEVGNAPGEFVVIYVDYTQFHGPHCRSVVKFISRLFDQILSDDRFGMMTPSEIIKNFPAAGTIDAPQPVSGIDNEKDLSPWLLNYMQQEAMEKLYSIGDKIRKKNDPNLFNAWNILQASDHLLYISTKVGNDGKTLDRFSPYPSPYEAFINYMNILNDFLIEVEKK